MARRWAWIGLALVLVTGCASRSASPQLQAEWRAAEELAAAGCYTCLRDALEHYDRVAGMRRPPADLPQRVFETEILLVFRAKEIGLPFEPWLTRARTTLQALPAALGAATALELAELVQEERSGFAPGPPGLARFAREVVPNLAQWRARVAATALGADMRQYLDLTLACSDRESRVAMQEEPPPVSANAAPLIRYRMATCGPAPSADITRLRADDPRWTEAAWHEGRRLLGSVRDVPLAIAAFEIAARAFPESGAMLMSLAGAQQAAEQLEASLVIYDQVLALVPEHRHALLGRVLSLTYLQRPEDAVVTATRMIDLGTHLLGDAYYWRAQNRHQLKAYDEAWADVTMALTQLHNTQVHTLAGLIAYARKEPTVALTHFDTAWSLDRTNCSAGFFKGIVHGDLKGWNDAAPTFSSAMSCFVAAASAARSELAALDTSDHAAAYKARKGEQLRKKADEDDRQAATSAYNAAQAFIRLGNPGLALNFVDVALGNEAMREKAEALKKQLKR